MVLEARATADDEDPPPPLPACCYEGTCSAQSCGDPFDEEWYWPPGAPAPQADWDYSKHVYTGAHGATLTANACEMNEDIAADLVELGDDLQANNLFENEAAVCRATASVDGTAVASTLGEPLTIDGLSVATGQGVTMTQHPDGPGASGNPVTGGDPIDPITGEFIVQEVDVALPGYSVAFELRRTYRSRVDFVGPMGPGWDHTYNQRLVSLPVIDAMGQAGTPGYPALPIAELTVPEIGAGDGTPSVSCGPSLVLSTGEATSIRFTEIANVAGTLSYRSTAELLVLIGTDGPGGLTWKLHGPGGDIRSFDTEGRLVRWTDADDIGLSIAWDGAGETSRVASVIDSVGRVVTFEYEGDRLHRISDGDALLEAVYEYDARGALETARGSDGRAERYEYDFDPARTRGNWVADVLLRSGCAAACAMSDATCSTGGACDDPVAAATNQCLEWVSGDASSEGSCKNDCWLECHAASQGGCDQYCDSSDTNTELYQAFLEDCERIYNEEGPREECESCEQQCYDDALAVCDTWECVDNLSGCCAHGEACAEGSCNAAIPPGDDCVDVCRNAFYGTSDNYTGCDHPHPASGCWRNEIEACKTDCYDRSAGAECIPSCQAQCVPSTCVELDLQGTCEDSCTSTCIDAGRVPGTLPGTFEPRFGHLTDLNFNIVRVYDGADRLYLENTYGTSVSSSDFDSVIAQQFGEYSTQFTRQDLVVDEGGDALPDPTPSWATGLIDAAADFEPVEICPFTCRDTPFDPLQWDEIVVPTATADLYLVFTPGVVASPLAGFAVNKTLTQPVGPTLVTFTRSVQGVVSGKINRRTSATNYFATTAASLPITLNGGATVTLATSTNGNVTVSGSTAGKDQLVQMGTMTLFTDAARRVKAYPGAPIEVLEATSGTCSVPFTYQHVSETEVRLSPTTACTGDLWLTAMAGRYPDQPAADRFPAQGLSALSATAFHPVTLSPTRAGAIWRQGIDGRRVREAPPSSAGTEDAGRSALGQYGASPMFSAPTATSGQGEPLFVFHHVAADYRVSSPPPPPSDRPWQQLDLPMPDVPLGCDSTVPASAIRGSGARPTQATAIVDFHGARWTEYADEDNNVLRRINHETGSVWSFNYDPIGQLIAIEHPDRARTCLVHDALGNVKRRFRMPAAVAGLPSPDAIREDFEFHEVTSALTKVGDPRSPGTWLRTILRDATGNPLSIQEAGGVTSATFTKVGGTGSDQFQIASATAPGSAVTTLTYRAGTIESVTVDPAGAALTENFIPDAVGRPALRIGALELEQSWSYDGPFLAFTEQHADGHVARNTFEYNDDGQVSAVRVGAPGAERLRTELTYDITGSVTRVSQIPLDGSATTATACQDVAPGGRRRETVSPEGIRTRYTHDGEGRVLSIVAGDLGPSPRSWDDGCLDHPPAGTQQFTLATFEYDTSGRLVTSTDERGLLTTITRDGLGRPVIIHRPDGTQLRRGYDALGNVVWEAVYVISGAPPYRPPSWTDGSLHAATEMVYDQRARLVEVRRWHFDGAQIPVGDGYATTRFAYDDIAHTVTRTDDANKQWVTRYDAAGRVVEERAPDGTARSYSYPGTDHRTVRISEPGPAGTITRDVTLTAWGAVTSQGPRVGTTTYPLSTTQFDELLRPILTTSLTGGSTAATYDALGRTTRALNSVPGGASETIDVGYDRDGRVLTRTSTADGATTGTWRWRYDALGREVDAQDPSGRRTTTTYLQGSQLPDVITDPRGVQFHHAWGTGVGSLYLNAIDPAGPDTYLTYVWNWRGDVTAASRTDEGQPQISNTFTFDSLGDQTRETDNQLPSAWTRATTFDGRGLPIKTTTNTTNWTRAYDALGRLDTIKVGTESTALADYSYAGFDFRLTRLLSNGVQTTTTYDVLGRPISQTDVKNGGTLASWAFQIPLDGVPRVADFRRGSVGGEKSVFTTDAALRLLDEDNGANPSFGLTPTTSWSSANASASAALGTQATHYALDGHSAWARRTIGTSVVDYLRDASDALTKIGTQNVSLDFRGAITNDGELAVVYDALGQVQRVTKGTTVRDYRRDAFGRIVREANEASAVTRYAWDGTSRIVRQRPDGTTFDINIDGAELDEHVATITGTSRQFLHQDRRGSVYMISDNTGVAREWTSYTAYGEAQLWNISGTKIASSGVNAQFGFNGLPHDVATGLVDMRARLYRPQLGRFLSPDPLGLVDGTNRFAFVGAMPLSFRDPFGLCHKHPEECAAWSTGLPGVWFDSIPNGWDYYTALHGLPLENQLEILRRTNNGFEGGACNTGRGWCAYVGVASSIGAAGDIITLGWGSYARATWGIDIVDQGSWDYVAVEIGALVAPFVPKARAAPTPIAVEVESSTTTAATRPGHAATFSVIRPDGTTRVVGNTVSAPMTAEEIALGPGNSRAAVHTEARIVRTVPVEAGETLLIDGILPPCSRCKGALNTLTGSVPGTTAVYSWLGDSGEILQWISQWGRRVSP